jgi:hypothetical protein
VSPKNGFGVLGKVEFGRVIFFITAKFALVAQAANPETDDRDKQFQS